MPLLEDSSQTQTKTPFNVTEASLNALVMNFTLSVIPEFNFWPISANVTRHQLRPQYSLSQPVNLILPYALTLALTFPLVLVGLWALRKNGVSATDNGFLQILTTTRGSRTLDRLAAGGCLGGQENIPASLKRLQVRYGELVNPTINNQGQSHTRQEQEEEEEEERQSASHRGQISLAGFGTEDEVIPIMVGRP
ncbi:hypothetical protein VTN00DRAFT_4237 [Thermoascus crustaceus]|uniref:uncharacterized protein n=1 Tax=Thermoascus crustaceus TaxID=5088 RepID=UPI0037422D84